MANVALTEEQRLEMRNNDRFQGLIRSWMSNKSLYWINPAFETAHPNGDAVRWARSRNLGADLIHVPESLQAERSYMQASIFLKDVPVNPSGDQTVFVINDVINAMIASDAFDALIDKIFDEQIKGRIGF